MNQENRSVIKISSRCIAFQGYRCELCQFKFHQKCGSKVPNYCDRMQQIPHDVHMANKLRDFCEQHGGPNAALVAEIIQHFQSPNAGQWSLSNISPKHMYSSMQLMELCVFQAGFSQHLCSKNHFAFFT